MADTKPKNSSGNYARLFGDEILAGLLQRFNLQALKLVMFLKKY